MTLREAADVIKRMGYQGKDQEEAVEMAVKALENLNLIRANAYFINKLVREVTENE